MTNATSPSTPTSAAVTLSVRPSEVLISRRPAPATTWRFVTRELLEVWIAELSSTCSQHAVWKAHTSLRAILKSAVEWGRIPSNPAAGLRLPKKTPGEEAAAARVLTVEQFAMLLGATGRVRVETMFRGVGEAGLRAGEVVGLRWPSVDLAGRRLTVERSVWQEAGRDGAPPRRIVKGTKSGRTRRVAISATFAARLADWYAESVVEGGADAAGYVWPGRDGGPMDSTTAGQALACVLRRAGLVDRNERPLITFHGLRHTAASIMLAHRVPLIVVSRQLGRANPNIAGRVVDSAAGVVHSLAKAEGAVATDSLTRFVSLHALADDDRAWDRLAAEIDTPVRPGESDP